jgi:deoxycytidylate deaminase
MEMLIQENANDSLRWLDAAAEKAKEALCLRAKCGSVIVKNGEIIGAGYNAPPQDNLAFRTCMNEYELPKNYRYDHTCCMHAEWRAIFDALKNHPDKIKGSTLYFNRVDENGQPKKSGKPYCTVCSRLALDNGVEYFVLRHEDGVGVYPTDEYDRLSYQNIKE